ncbi:Platelet-activating factor acetylhydrolase IB subunit beta-like protein [Gryllus bimaculatus]|nr:Platelet-activating factor acetylhydrolase IB subunit beta-like protein [Gryllus bimaculatus]
MMKLLAILLGLVHLGRRSEPERTGDRSGYVVNVLIKKMNPAAIPVPVEDVQGDGRWLSMHKRFLLEAKEKEPEVIFIGDSIIQQMSNCEIWSKYFVPMHALNFGISGDQTQHVLWRIENGELEHVNPKVIVVLVGTNNFDFSPEEITEGILEIVRVIREKQPQAYIVLPTLLPRGQNPNPLRERNSKVNKLVSERVTSDSRCEVVAIDKGFVLADGTISHHDMFDYLHLTNLGYQKAFEPVYELLLQLLSEGEKEDDANTISE